MKFKIPSDFKNVKEASQKVLQSLNGRELSDSFLLDVRLACEEAVINAIKHGNKTSPGKTVNISCDVKEGAVVITVEDEGRGFDYQNLPNPTEEENVFKGCGRGLFLIHHAMDKVEFNSSGNKITMTKYFSKSGRGKNAD